MTSQIDVNLTQIAEQLNSFWLSPSFWIGTVLSAAGLLFSILAFFEARKARKAAVEAGRTVKGQTVAIELSEMAQRLDAIQPEISYREARDLLSEISRRVRRVISPFADDAQLASAVQTLRASLLSAQDSLKTVRPTDPGAENRAPDAVYFGVENDFSAINNAIADFLGVLEKRMIERGVSNGR